MPARPRAAPGVVELLRLFVVLFFAGIGYEVGRSAGTHAVLGPFDSVAVGVIVGSGVGFVLGGVLGRTTVTAVDATEAALRDVSADSLVASAAGTVIGLVAGSAVAWPLFLIRRTIIAVPLFFFLIVVAGLVGQRFAAGRQEAVLAVVGPRAGLAPRPAPVAALPRVLDTSVAIDGRVLDVVRAGFLHGTVLVPAAVVGELQAMADSADDLRRAKGRRGLDALQALKREPAVTLEVLDEALPEVAEVDSKLVRLCLDRGWALLTFDTALARAAALAGVPVLNMHALALALRPPVTAGDEVRVLLLKAGKEAGQAVGYLDDGTMVVVERARQRVGRETAVRVLSVLITANGRMVFAEPVSLEGAG
ncbi:MAG: PIN domain-containing protein [Mycobacteriales bacterium]